MRRPPPLPLVWPVDRPDGPICPMCTADTVYDGYGWLCAECDAWWQDIVYHGEWLEPKAPQCPSVRAVHGMHCRCALAAGHDEWHRPRRWPGVAWDADHVHTYLPGLPPIDCATGQPCECDIPAHL